MIIILKKIPANTSSYHIETFMASTLKGGVFKVSGRIENISFWRYEIVQTGAIEYYALVDVEPDTVGERVIKRLNKKQLNGKYIAMQEYYVRHWSNDRRVFKSVLNRGKNNKRQTDRRRKIIKTEINTNADLVTKDITISSHSSFWNAPNNKRNK